MASAPIDFKIEASAKDIASLDKALSRAEKELGKDTVSAIEFAARMVARSARAATKEAKQYRKYEQVGRARRGERKTFRVHNDKTGKTNTVLADSVADLKTKPGVKILNRGLAKHVWSLIGGKVGEPDADTVVNGRTATVAGKYVSVDIDRSPLAPSITLRNSLDYAGLALKGGRGALDGIVGKASRQMLRVINSHVKQRTAAI
jgi:hypothetical protein